MTSLALKTFVWKVDPALSVADADAKGVALRLRGGSLLVQPDDAVIIGVEPRGVEGCAFCSVFQYRRVIGFMVINGSAAGGSERVV